MQNIWHSFVDMNRTKNRSLLVQSGALAAFTFAVPVMRSFAEVDVSIIPPVNP